MSWRLPDWQKRTNLDPEEVRGRLLQKAYMYTSHKRLADRPEEPISIRVEACTVRRSLNAAKALAADGLLRYKKLEQPMWYENSEEGVLITAKGKREYEKVVAACPKPKVGSRAFRVDGRWDSYIVRGVFGLYKGGPTWLIKKSADGYRFGDEATVDFWLPRAQGDRLRDELKRMDARHQRAEVRLERERQAELDTIVSEARGGS